MKYDAIIVGAGICGISAARYLADKGKKVFLVEKTNRIGGLCKEGHFKGTRFSIYGAHLFHTDNQEVWDFLSRFTDWEYYTHEVRSFCKGKLWTIPIDYSELGQHPEYQELLLKSYLYEDYNKKMWGEYSEHISSNSLKRLNMSSPLDKRYFKDKYQAFPANGYDEMFMKMIDNKNITILLNGDFNVADIAWLQQGYSNTPIIYTGRIDKILGKNILPFMTMGFQTVLNSAFPWSDKYGVINFPQDYDFIRAHSSKILYKQDTKNDVVVYEYPRWTGPECYPIRYGEEFGPIAIYNGLVKELEKKYPNIIPAGRAGKFEHMNLDEAVLDGLYCASSVLSKD